MRILSGLILTNGSRRMGHDRFERNENTGRTNSQRGRRLFLENDLVKTNLENLCVKNKP
jgi:hypothetical protein